MNKVRGIILLDRINNVFSKLLVVMPLAFYFQATVAFSQQNEPNEYIKLGTSNALSGPTKNVGQRLIQGASAYFKRLNENGGIHGRKVKLVSLDDGYEPRRTVSNTRKLIEVEEVFALFGYMGTPTSQAILPILNKSQIPYLMPFTGASFLRKPIIKNIFNLRASYYQEAQAQVDYLVNKLSFQNIALVIQADEFGLSVQRTINNLLSKHNISPIITTRFKRNTNDIENILVKLMKKPVEAVIFIGTYQPFANLVNSAYRQEFKPVFTSFSVDGKSIFTRLKYPSRVIVTEVIPAPEKCNWQLCQQFITDMKEAGIKKPNRTQLEAYLNAFVFSQAAKKCPVKLTTQCLLQKLESFSFKDNELNINFSADNHQGMQQVYLSFSEAEKIHQASEPYTN